MKNERFAVVVLPLTAIADVFKSQFAFAVGLFGWKYMKFAATVSIAKYELQRKPKTDARCDNHNHKLERVKIARLCCIESMVA